MKNSFLLHCQEKSTSGGMLLQNVPFLGLVFKKIVCCSMGNGITHSWFLILDFALYVKPTCEYISLFSQSSKICFECNCINISLSEVGYYNNSLNTPSLNMLMHGSKLHTVKSFLLSHFSS